MSITIDATTPSTPAAPHLQAASDTGLSNSDGITKINNPTFDISSGSPYFRFYRDGVLIGGSYQTGATLTSGALADGSYSFTLTAVDAAGNESAPSATPTLLTIDTIAPALPSAPDLEASSDSGVSSTDNITNVKTPTFDLNAAPYFRFFTGGTQLGGNYLAGTTFTTSQLSDGSYSFTAQAVDAAGNLSAPSSALAVTVDTLPFVPNVIAPGSLDNTFGSAGRATLSSLRNVFSVLQASGGKILIGGYANVFRPF